MSEYQTSCILRCLLRAGIITGFSVLTLQASSGSVFPLASEPAPGAIPQDTRIVVNAPAFRMDVFEAGELIKSYRIAIGYPEFPLPTGIRGAETIIVSPTWTPPQEPWVKTPRSRVKAGEKIAAGDKLNPLGPIKIPIGLPSLIHGGKSPAVLGRFGSHGCVGLTDAGIEDFASRLAQITGTQISPQQIANLEKKKTQTETIKLSKPVAVELRYETIVVVDGRLHIYRDVYSRGTNTEENLRNVLQAYGVSPDQLSAHEKALIAAGLKAMARDAKGRPVVKPKEVKNGTSARVTRVIRGRKEVIVKVAALSGKGYPAPMYMTKVQPRAVQAYRSRR